ncbi:MAG: MauE/DoxX family redox-associated membrane protein [Ilumatobacteraceae bacterium]
MDVVAVIASVVLGIAFVVAGGSKIAAGDSWPIQARGLGAPNWTLPIVPWVEIAVGAALVAQLVPPWPAVVALGMLVAFTGLIGVALSQGRHPPCACFGAWSAKPIGPGHLARNGALIALALIAIVAVR